MAKRTNKRNRVFGVSFGKKALSKIASEVQGRLDEIDAEGLDMRAIMNVGNKGVLLFTERKGSEQPEEDSGAEKMPTNPLEFIANLVSQAGKGRVDMKVLSLPPPPNELCPSEDLLKVLTPMFPEGMNSMMSDKKTVAERFERATKDLPPHKMKELAAEAELLMTDHKKHCSSNECPVHKSLGEASTRLTEKAKLNTQ